MPLPRLHGSIATITDLKKLDYNLVIHVTACLAITFLVMVAEGYLIGILYQRTVKTAE